MFHETKKSNDINNKGTTTTSSGIALVSLMRTLVKVTQLKQWLFKKKIQKIPKIFWEC